MRGRLVGRPWVRVSGVAVAAAALATAIIALTPTGSIKAGSAQADPQPEPRLALNIALTGTAIASTYQTNDPLGNAIDATRPSRANGSSRQIHSRRPPWPVSRSTCRRSRVALMLGTCSCR